MAEETIWVAGTDHYQTALKTLLTEENDEYMLPKNDLLDDCGYDEDDRIYQYHIAEYPLHVYAEPSNPYDPQAVRVFAGSTFVGYLPRGSFPDLKRLAFMPNVHSCVKIYGGKYKYLEYDDEEDFFGERENKYFTLRTEQDPIRAIIVFTW